MALSTDLRSRRHADYSNNKNNINATATSSCPISRARTRSPPCARAPSRLSTNSIPASANPSSPRATRRRTPTIISSRSDNTIRCFFEEEAFGADGQLKQAKSLSINKIGHAMHDLDPVFRAFSRRPETGRKWRATWAWRTPQVWQSMYIFKQPGIGGEVRWHQDATYLRHHADQRDHLLVRAGRRDPGQRLPVGGTGRPPRPHARTLRAQRRRRCAWKNSTPRRGPTTARPCRWK